MWSQMYEEAKASASMWLDLHDRSTAERDRARDLAAHLEEELAALRTAADDQTGSDELLMKVSDSLCVRWPGSYGGPGCFVGHVDPRTVVQAVLRAALAAHLEAEQAEGQK